MNLVSLEKTPSQPLKQNFSFYHNAEKAYCRKGMKNKFEKLTRVLPSAWPLRRSRFRQPECRHRSPTSPRTRLKCPRSQSWTRRTTLRRRRAEACSKPRRPNFQTRPPSPRQASPTWILKRKNGSFVFSLLRILLTGFDLKFFPRSANICNIWEGFSQLTLSQKISWTWSL